MMEFFFVAHLQINRTAFSGLMNYGLGLSIESGGFDNQRNQNYEWNYGFQMVLNDTLHKAVRSSKGIDAQCSITGFETSGSLKII